MTILTLGESWLQSGAEVFKNDDEALTKEKAKEIYKQFLETVKVGVEIEGSCDLNAVKRFCGKTPQECGKCVKEKCEGCSTCTPKNMNRCFMYGHTTCKAHQNTDDCSSCDPCAICDKCERCHPCEGCDFAVTKIEDVYNRITKELGCKFNKQNIEDISKIKGNFLYVYPDGSCNTELVTNSVPLSKLSEVLKIGFDTLTKYCVKLSPEMRAGMHQTFSYDGYFPQVVAKNMVQLLRFYLPALISISCVDKTQFRGDYRRLPPVPGWSKSSKRFNNKYEAGHVKEQNALAGSPKLLEFRYPDSTPNVKQHLIVAIINEALVLKAINFSINGVVAFSLPHWRNIEVVMNILYKEGFSHNPKINDEYDCHQFIKVLRENMFEFIKPELEDIIEDCDEFIDSINYWKIPVTAEQTEVLEIKLKN